MTDYLTEPHNNKYITDHIVPKLLAADPKVPPLFEFANDVPKNQHKSTPERAYYGQMRPREIREFKIPQCKNMSWLVYWNNGGGNCYWVALAQLLCGGEEYWPWVKAAHKIWLDYVLRDKQHPRHGLYTKLEHNATEDRRKNSVVLRTPGAWTSSTSMGQVTADLYDIFLIIFDDDNSPVGVDMYGCQNATQRFLRYKGSHFEPVLPIVPRPSEFHFPVNTNRGYDGEGGKLKSLNGNARQHKIGFVVPEQLLPRPFLPRPSTIDLEIAVGKDLPWRPLKRRNDGTTGQEAPPSKRQRSTELPSRYPEPGISGSQSEDDEPEATAPGGRRGSLRHGLRPPKQRP